jgi:hypothetical protein
MGLTDLFSVLFFAFIIIVFYFLLKLQIGKTSFDLRSDSANIEESLSIINFLKTQVNIEGNKMDIAQAIALSYKDQSKKDWLKQNLGKYIEDTFVSLFSDSCSMICVLKDQYNDEYDKWEKFSESQECIENAPCPDAYITIPSYSEKPIVLTYGTSKMGWVEKTGSKDIIRR